MLLSTLHNYYIILFSTGSCVQKHWYTVKTADEEVNEYPLAPVQPAKVVVTHLVIELPKPHDQSPPPEVNFVDIEVKELTATLAYS